MKKRIFFRLIFSCYAIAFMPMEAALSQVDSSKQRALIDENAALRQEGERVAALYALKKGERIREITAEVLQSSTTPAIGKKSIETYQRRIFVFTYPSDGLLIKGFVSFTPHPEYHPLLVLYRWGNGLFALMNPGVPLATYKNYTVLSSTLRGGVSEGVDEFGGKDVDDMKNLIAYIPTLAKELGITLHPSCISMIGPSRGGMEMFLTLAHFPQLQKKVNKIVALSALLDLHQQIEDRPKDMKLMLEDNFGMPKGKKQEAWIAQRNPIEAIQAINPSIPVLIVQGTDDNRVNLLEGKKMAEALKETGHAVNYWEINGGNHVLTNRPSIMNDIARWLESNSPCMSIKYAKESTSLTAQ